MPCPGGHLTVQVAAAPALKAERTASAAIADAVVKGVVPAPEGAGESPEDETPTTLPPSGALYVAMCQVQLRTTAEVAPSQTPASPALLPECPDETAPEDGEATSMVATTS